MSRKNEAVRYILEIGKSIFEEVHSHYTNNYFRTVINRLYYSCFNATKALLLTKDLMPKTHKGVLNQLHEHFVSPGLFEKAKADFFQELMKERIICDYGDILEVSQQKAKAFLEPGKAYFEYVQKMVEDYLKTEEQDGMNQKETEADS